MRFRTLLLMILLIPVTVLLSHARNTVNRTYHPVTDKDTTISSRNETAPAE